jgi:hypothetical protein
LKIELRASSAPRRLDFRPEDRRTPLCPAEEVDDQNDQEDDDEGADADEHGDRLSVNLVFGL